MRAGLKMWEWLEYKVKKLFWQTKEKEVNNRNVKTFLKLEKCRRPNIWITDIPIRDWRSNRASQGWGHDIQENVLKCKNYLWAEWTHQVPNTLKKHRYAHKYGISVYDCKTLEQIKYPKKLPNKFI